MRSAQLARDNGEKLLTRLIKHESIKSIGNEKEGGGPGCGSLSRMPSNQVWFLYGHDKGLDPDAFASSRNKTEQDISELIGQLPPDAIDVSTFPAHPRFDDFMRAADLLPNAKNGRDGWATTLSHISRPAIVDCPMIVLRRALNAAEEQKLFRLAAYLAFRQICKQGGKDITVGKSAASFETKTRGSASGVSALRSDFDRLADTGVYAVRNGYRAGSGRPLLVVVSADRIRNA